MTRFSAVAALGALKDDALQEISATCTSEAPTWTLAFTEWNEAMIAGLTDRPIECLAKAQLTR